MSNTKIKWTDATWLRVLAVIGEPETRIGEFSLLQPLRWKKGRRISLGGDLFHQAVTDEMLDRIFAVMALCPQHTFQVLTKRPDRMLAYFDPQDCGGRLATARVRINRLTDQQFALPKGRAFPRGVEAWPLPNVWLGVSVENQKAADERIPLLLQTPAAVRFISAEPLQQMIRIVSFIGHTNPECDLTEDDCRCDVAGLDWVIVGGAFGRVARPMHPDWARSLRDQCVAAGVPFFFKQWGEWLEYGGGKGWHFTREVNGKPYGKVFPPETGHKHNEALFDGRDFETYHFPYPGGLGPCMVRVGKKSAGRLLDGREWNELPEVLL